MLVILLILCTHLFTVCNCQGWVVQDSGCRTPDGGTGSCIAASRCKPITDILTKYKKSLPESVKQQLYSYYCSYDKGVKVCCPSGPVNLQESESPPDVSNHRNLNLLPTDCGYLQTPDRIIGGTNASLNEFPWMALLSYRSKRGLEFKCGGTIINNRYILTAAHCISHLDSPLAGVRVGEYDVSTKQDCVQQKDGTKKCTAGVRDLAIEKIIPHPRYNASTFVNDIGLLRLSKMKFNVENIRPVCLPLGDFRTEQMKFGTVTGWGYTNALTGAVSSILQKVNLPVVELEQCKEIYKTFMSGTLSNKQLCAGGKGKKDSCGGDSGGPFHKASFGEDGARYVQQGVVSFGHKNCGLEGVPGVYTRVAYYMDWILDTIKP